VLAEFLKKEEEEKDLTQRAQRKSTEDTEKKNPKSTGRSACATQERR
jgi:hypothetical protein